MSEIEVQASSGKRPKSERVVWGTILLIWFLALCYVPDPRPLSTPDWSIHAIRGLVEVSEPVARAIATIALRGIGFAVTGILVALVFSSSTLRWAIPFVLIAAPVLSIASQRINYGYFPIRPQYQVAVFSAILGGFVGLSLRRSRVAIIATIALIATLLLWGTSTGITDELDLAARTTGLHVLENAAEVPHGDDGFTEILRLAFVFAEDNSHGSDATVPNQAAIIALGVILGDEQVARVAKRSIDLSRHREFEFLRNRIRLQGRKDLSRHFWVSAALSILLDDSRSMTVGIGKEMMDAAPGGSGFSFADLTADRAGGLFADNATRSPEAARAMQTRIRDGCNSSDFCPDVTGLPEGLTSDEFQSVFGGLGGAKTKEIVREIERRLATCELLGR